jgi:hypothetical protein
MYLNNLIRKGRRTMPVSEAQKRASKKWSQSNKDKIKIITYRSCAKTFIKKIATAEELDSLMEMINERKKELAK